MKRDTLLSRCIRSLVLLLCTGRCSTNSCLLPGGHLLHSLPLASQLYIGFPVDTAISSHPQPQSLKLGYTSLLDILMFPWLFLNCTIELLGEFPTVTIKDTYHYVKAKAETLPLERIWLAFSSQWWYWALYAHRSFYSMIIMNLHHILWYTHNTHLNRGS